MTYGLNNYTMPIATGIIENMGKIWFSQSRDFNRRAAENTEKTIKNFANSACSGEHGQLPCSAKNFQKAI